MKKELLFVSVIGKDRKGIVAKISNYLYKRDINIEDITQTVMEGYFVMTMAVDMQDTKYELEKINSGLQKIGNRMKIMISIRHENIFKSMHRI